MAVMINWMAEARRLESSGDIRGAVGIYRKALVKQEETAGFADLSLRNGLGDLYLRAGEMSDALEEYERAAEQCEEQQLYANGIALCKKILRNAPEHLSAFRRVARLSALSGLEAEARLYYTRYRDGLAGLGREGEALECLREIVDAVADEESTLALADAMVAQGEPDQALEILRDVKQRREADARGVVLVIRSIQELQNQLGPAESEPDHEAAQEAAQDGISVHEMSGSREEAPDLEGPPAEGRSVAPRGLALGPMSPTEAVSPVLQELQAVMGELEGAERMSRALELIEQLLELRPGNFELLSRKLHYAYVLGDEGAAVSAYLDLGKSLDRGLEGFNLRALSSVGSGGRVTAVVRVEDIPGLAPGS